MTDEIEQVRRSLSVERQISSLASDWTEDRGGDRVGRCTHPVHGHTSGNSDGTPNLIVTEDEGWYCYSHETGGGIFEWVAVEEGICRCSELPLSDEQFKEALRAAADIAGVDLTPSEARMEVMSAERRAQYELETAIDILHDNLDTVIDGRTVRHIIKESRGFDDETIDQARIGYIDGKTHSNLLDVLTPEQLQRIGFYRDNNSLHVENRIIYPYLQAGLPTYWIGRRTEESPSEAKYKKPAPTCVLDQPIYIASPPSGAVTNDVWVTEGIQDAISVATEVGVEAISAVATNPSAKQLNQLTERAREADRVVVCFDDDDAGVHKAADLAITLMSHGIETNIATVPDGEDPNDFFADGGDAADLEPKLAAEKIIEEQGGSPPVIRRILSTVEPDSMRADRIISKLSAMTEMTKPTLRKQLRKGYREESQTGWMEPVRISKTSGADPDFILHYANGEKIVMPDVAGRRVEQRFAQKYAQKFNYVPDLTASEWSEYMNEWLRTVEVTDVDPLSEEGQVRETVLGEIQRSEASEDITAVVGNSIYDIYVEDDTVMIANDTIKRWVEDYGVSLRQVSEYLSVVLKGGSVQRSCDGERHRFWRFDPEAIADQGYRVPDADEEPAPDTGEPEDDVDPEVIGDD